MMPGILSHSLAGTAMQTNTFRQQSSPSLGDDVGGEQCYGNFMCVWFLHVPLHGTRKAVF